jgi:hypothetical protein
VETAAPVAGAIQVIVADAMPEVADTFVGTPGILVVIMAVVCATWLTTVVPVTTALTVM